MERLLRGGRGDAAVARARAAYDACREHGALVRLAARMLLATSQSAAALELLEGHVAAHPDDCESRSWLAWALLERNDPAAAWRALQDDRCPARAEEVGRWALLEALIERDLGELARVAPALRRLSERSPLWREDRALRTSLARAFDRYWRPPWEGSLEIGAGGTTDAYAGSPTDATRSEIESGLLTVNATSAFRLPAWSGIVPIVELNVRGHGIAAERARELSYLELGGRIGTEIPLGRARATLALRRDALVLDRERESRYADGLRGELDLDLGRISVFAGGGRRTLAESGRSRRELDLGAGASLGTPSLPVSLVVAGRRFDANESVYDQRSVTASAVAWPELGVRWRARVGLTLSHDDYPHSGGFPGLFAFGNPERRRDRAVRLSIGSWWRVANAARLGLTYEAGRRWSTIERGWYGSYAYREQRLILSLRLVGAGNPWRRTTLDPDHVGLDYGALAAPEPLADERLRDLVRANEEVRTGCGCGL